MTVLLQHTFDSVLPFTAIASTFIFCAIKRALKRLAKEIELIDKRHDSCELWSFFVTHNGYEVIPSASAGGDMLK